MIRLVCIFILLIFSFQLVQSNLHDNFSDLNIQLETINNPVDTSEENDNIEDVMLFLSDKDVFNFHIGLQSLQVFSHINHFHHVYFEEPLKPPTI